MHRTRLWRRGGLAVAFVALTAVSQLPEPRHLRSDATASAAVCPTGYELVADKEAAERRAGIREVESSTPRCSPTAPASTRPSIRRS